MEKVTKHNTILIQKSMDYVLILSFLRKSPDETARWKARFKGLFLLLTQSGGVTFLVQWPFWYNEGRSINVFGFLNFILWKLIPWQHDWKYLIKSVASFHNCTISVILMQHLFLCSYWITVTFSIFWFHDKNAIFLHFLCNRFHSFKTGSTCKGAWPPI